jgi:ribosomal protein S18 acetylase RimI-like enzyme
MIPDGVRVLPFDAAHHDAVVAFENRFLSASQQWAPERSKRWDRENPDPDMRRVIVVDDGDRIVATAFARSSEVVGKANGAYSIFARVDPAWQRRGIGTALIAQMERHARDKGAPRTLTLTYGNESAGLAYLERHGYREYSRRTRWAMRLDAFDPRRYAAPTEIADDAGVAIVALGPALERVGDLRRQIYDAHRAILNELPLPLRPNFPPFETYAPQLDDPEIERDSSAVALRGDRLVGLIVIQLLDNGIASSIVTGTVADGRGKRLGLALKLHALDVLKRRGRDLVVTLNDADNVPTLRILRTLGFEAEPELIRFEKKLV